MDIKRCCTCKQYKPFSDFYRSRNRSDGCHSQCKDCCRAYNRTEARKASHRKYDQSLRGRQANQKYSQSLRGRRAAYRSSQKHKRKYPEQIKATTFLNNAVQSGKIQKPQECAICGKKTKLHGHHHKGYAEENALDVLWLCRKCHAQLHQEKIIEGER